MTHAMMVERLDAAVTRIEAELHILREARQQAERRAVLLEAAAERTIGALDALIATGETAGQTADGAGKTA